MIQSAVTLSLVPQARGGPFVFWDDLDQGCQAATQLGFDAIEIFAPGAEALDSARLQDLLTRSGLKLAAMGTGAGWVLHKLTLTDPDHTVRKAAQDFIVRIIDFAAKFGAPAIIGSMQGRTQGSVDRTQAMAWLAEGLEKLGRHAQQRGMPLLIEPLNRYETNLLNRVDETLDLLGPLPSNLRLLCDLFHMNIEETSIPQALRRAGATLGHIHFVDSNRRPAGLGHLDFLPIIQTLTELQFEGFLSAEALPYPDSYSAAEQTIRAFRQFVPPAHRPR